MKNKKSILLHLFLVSIIGLSLNGCTGDREAIVPQYNTGIKKTADWKKYNNYAKDNNQPIIDFAATTLKYKKFGVKNYDYFLPEDPKVTIQTKWHNCKVSDLYEFKFYMPDGRLYHYEKFSPSKDNTKWTIGRDMNINGTSAERIQGKWTVEIIVNGKRVITKDFKIGKTIKEAIQKNPSKIIGFAPYWNSKLSTWNHSKSAPIFVSSETLYDNENVKIIPVKLVLKDMSNPQLSYEEFEKQITEDLKDDYGILLPVAKAHNMDYFILGKVESAWGIDSLDTKIYTYIVDVSEKKIIDTIETSYNLNRSNFNIATRNKSPGLHPLRIKVYNELYKNLKDKIKNISMK